MAEKSFLQLFSEARERDSYWAEKAKLQFAEAVYELMRRRGVTESDLAISTGISALRITRALRGDASLTIEEMIGLARRLQGRLEIQVVGSA